MPAATFFTTEMAQMVSNYGGAIQNLLPVTLNGGRERVVVGHLALAGQANGSVIHVARLPLGAAIQGINVITDTSLGAATISFGDAASAALYGAAATLTTVNGRQAFGLAATIGAIISAGYDAVSGAAVTMRNPGNGGAFYEDVVMTIGAAALPGAGNMVIQVFYTID